MRHVHAYCVDNALVKPGDPTFVGFCALRNVAAGAKVIACISAANMALKAGMAQVAIDEYSALLQRVQDGTAPPLSAAHAQMVERKLAEGRAALGLERV